MPEFRSWAQSAGGKQKADHVRSGRAVLALEQVASQSADASAFDQVPFPRMLSPDSQLQSLQTALARELDFCLRKEQDIEQAVRNGHALTDAHMHGVTYGPDGLGGSYGGVPRARQSMLDGIWDLHSDENTENEDHSEVTDLADSWLGYVPETRASRSDQDATSLMQAPGAHDGATQHEVSTSRDAGDAGGAGAAVLKTVDRPSGGHDEATAMDTT